MGGKWYPDHDTIARFRQTFLAEVTDLFAQVPVVAHELGLLKLGNISMDGSKVHADASKSHAVSYGRLLQLEQRLHVEVEKLMALGEKAEQGNLPEGLDVEFEITLRQDRLLNLRSTASALDQAKAVLEGRTEERYEAEKAQYEAKLWECEERVETSGCKPRGKAPKPPTAGPRAKDQYNCTDRDSRIMAVTVIT